MIQIENLLNVLYVGTICGVIGMLGVQKVKETKLFKKRTAIVIMSAVVNVLLSFGFCLAFTTLDIKNTIAVCVISIIGADSIYKALSDKGLLKGLNEIKEEK